MAAFLWYSGCGVALIAMPMGLQLVAPLPHTWVVFVLALAYWAYARLVPGAGDPLLLPLFSLAVFLTMTLRPLTAANNPNTVARKKLVLGSCLLLASAALLRPFPPGPTCVWAAAYLVPALRGPCLTFDLNLKGMRGMAVNLLVLALATITCALMLEGTTRLLLDKPLHSGSAYARAHPSRIHEFIPNADAVEKLDTEYDIPDAPDGRTEYRVVISSQGLRDRFFGPKAQGEFRILMLGDSFTMGWGVENHETIPKALERLLNSEAGGKNVTVINAGVVGYGPWQERLLFHDIGLALEPDLVVLQVFSSNDLSDSLRQEGRFFRAYYPVNVANYELHRYAAFRHIRFEQWLQEHSFAYSRAAGLAGNTNPLARLLEQFRFVPQRPSLDLPPRSKRWPIVEGDLLEWYPEIERGWELFQRDVQALADDCRSRDIAFLAYCIPPVELLHDPHWELLTSGAGHKSYERGKSFRLIEGFLEAAPFDHVSLLDRFSHMDPLELYFYHNWHLTPLGCEIAAEELARAIRRSYGPAIPPEQQATDHGE